MQRCSLCAAAAKTDSQQLASVLQKQSQTNGLVWQFCVRVMPAQVSAFGSDTQTDGGDVWSVEWDTKSKHWKQDAKVRRPVQGQLPHDMQHVL